MRELFIADRRIADDEPAFCIAEIGLNHGGSMEMCMRMMEVAKQSGAAAVKLQKRDNKTLYPKAMYDAPYNSEHAYGRTYGEHREALEFGWDEYCKLKTYAEEWLDIIFFATAFDIPSVNFLAHLGVPAIKLASGDVCNYPLLEAAQRTGLPLIISTGGHEIGDVYRTYGRLRGQPFAILHATAAYPCPHDLLNLRVIETYRDAFPRTVIGISDHNDGISMAPVAWMLGARIFEKHFTLNRAAKGSDNHFSLEPEAFRRMVNDLRGVALALGDGIKRAYAEEEPAMRKMKSILWEYP